MELFKEIIQIMIFTIITGCGIVIVKKFLDVLNNKIDELQANTKLTEYEKLNKIIDQAQKVVTDIVTSVNQVFVQSLKDSGKFTEESARIAKDAAIDKANELINKETVGVIETIHGSFNSWLDVEIEKAVNNLKKN